MSAEDLDLSEFSSGTVRQGGACTFRGIVRFLTDDQYAKIAEVMPMTKTVRHSKIAEVLTRWAEEGGWTDDLGVPVPMMTPFVVSRHRRGGCACGALMSPTWRST